MESIEEKRYKYHTNPEFGQDINLKAIEIGRSLDINSIGHELALCGMCLISGKAVILDPSNYSIIDKEKQLCYQIQ